MKKETIEQAAYQARRDYQDEVGKDGMNECIMFDAMKIQKGFELGAQWQAERMYSEEEVLSILYKHTEDLLAGKKLTLEDWFNDIKKK